MAGKSPKQSGMSSWFALTTAIAVGLLSILHSFPNPELDMEKVVLPSAAEYAKDVLGIEVDPDSNQPLKGISIAITGATSGIGMGLTIKLFEMGATVIAIGRSPKKLKKLKQDISDTLETVVMDFADFDSVARGSEEMLERFESLDVLVNNAGIHTIENGLFAPQPPSKQGYDIPFAGK